MARRSVCAWHHCLVPVVAFAVITFVDVYRAWMFLAAVILGLIAYC